MELVVSAIVHAQEMRDVSALRLLQRQLQVTRVAVVVCGCCPRRGSGRCRWCALAVAKGNGSGCR
eukprot:9118095-Pyramimonas_sp.AAC.1